MNRTVYSCAVPSVIYYITFFANSDLSPLLSCSIIHLYIFLADLYLYSCVFEYSFYKHKHLTTLFLRVYSHARAWSSLMNGRVFFFLSYLFDRRYLGVVYLFHIIFCFSEIILAYFYFLNRFLVIYFLKLFLGPNITFIF